MIVNRGFFLCCCESNQREFVKKGLILLLIFSVLGLINSFTSLNNPNVSTSTTVGNIIINILTIVLCVINMKKIKENDKNSNIYYITGIIFIIEVVLTIIFLIIILLDYTVFAAAVDMHDDIANKLKYIGTVMIIIVILISIPFLRIQYICGIILLRPDERKEIFDNELDNNNHYNNV